MVDFSKGDADKGGLKSLYILYNNRSYLLARCDRPSSRRPFFSHGRDTETQRVFNPLRLCVSAVNEREFQRSSCRRSTSAAAWSEVSRDMPASRSRSALARAVSPRAW